MKCCRLKNVLIWQNSDADDFSNPDANKAKKKDEEYHELDTNPYHANLVTSNIVGDYHYPCLDIDIPMNVVVSSSGNKHIYFQTPKPLTTEQYDKLLIAMKECGIIQEGIYNGFKRRGYTSLRLPGLRKGTADDKPLLPGNSDGGTISGSNTNLGGSGDNLFPF